MKIDDELQLKLDGIEITPKEILELQERRQSLCHNDPDYEDVQEQTLHALNTFNTKSNDIRKRNKKSFMPLPSVEPKQLRQVEEEFDSGW